MGRRGDPDMMAVLVEPGSLAVGKEVPLADEESNHLKVRRANNGATIRLLDGAGTIATGLLTWRGKKASVSIGTVVHVAEPAPLTLAVGAGDRDRFGWVVEKCAELGVTDLIPLASDHATGVATRIREDHIDKLAVRARETLKQSGAAWAPRVHPLQSIEQCSAMARRGLRWLAQPGGALPPAALDDEPITIVIGPEGGWTEQELGHLLARFEPIALAAPILRFETAALAAASVVGIARLRGARV
ncbi:MAG: RsmE family RNA methyltransferase [Gemmatimonadota bacterium]